MILKPGWRRHKNREMTRQRLNSDGLLDARFLDKSYREAIELTRSVATYLEQEDKGGEPFGLDSETKIFHASESMRISTCLMQVVSWFLVQKAVAAGEMTREEAGAEKHRLGARDVCLADVDRTGIKVPEEFLTYLDQAQGLYLRVARVDDMVYDRHSPENPVHEMFTRLRDDDISE